MTSWARTLRTTTTSRSTRSTSRPPRVRRRLGSTPYGGRRRTASGIDGSSDAGLHRVPGPACTRTGVRLREDVWRSADSKCLDHARFRATPSTSARFLRASLGDGLHGRARRGPGELRAWLRDYFDNLGALKNSDGGCDLENIDPIGKADVTVTARYPYQPVTASDPAAAPVHFDVHSLFHKTLTSYAKGPGARTINCPHRPGPRTGHRRLAARRTRSSAGMARVWARTASIVFPTSSAGGDIFDSVRQPGHAHRLGAGQERVLHRSVQRPGVHARPTTRATPPSRSSTPRARRSMS